MKTIQVTKSKSTNLLPHFNSIKTIEIDDKPIAEGAFGEVYICRSINNTAIREVQVIKVFKEDNNNRQDHNVHTIENLQNKLEVKNNEYIKKGSSLINEFPALKGVPQFSYTGTLNGKVIRGFSSNNLKKLGFEEFIDILEKDNLYKSYQSLGIDKKMLIAYRLVSAFRLLNEINFIHADLKPEALFINTSSAECAIIDFDSGTITINPNDEPNVWGAPNDWVAPEIWEQLKLLSANGIQKVKVNLLTDMWSVCVGVHYILTTTHPLFFLNELSPRTSNFYFSKYQWPNVDTNETYFNQGNSTIYQPIKNWLENTLPKSIFVEFSKTINNGYNKPINRTNYKDWEKVLLSVQEPPKITKFESDKDISISGIQVRLSWDVQSFYKLIIQDGKQEIDVSNLQFLDVSPSVDSTYKLIAKGHFGESMDDVFIKVFPVPMIKSINVPMPQFNQTTQLSNITISVPQINIGVNLKTNIFQTSNIDFVKLSQEAKNICIDTHTIFNVSDIFDALQSKIKEKLKKMYKL